ncbi:LVIS_2131 family protein [Lactobacillus sp. ESL0684]|uniref:LVIS_2131 family protein n=1 Tax=unclassified Lactobacillus TaxID=2620435 RepID=UPI0023F69C9E|nr:MULTISPECIES: LVIS_2131 family protein [unclassified Lactobacillus]WEV39598.1 LVIS_2131 family protein [Lactobacillus sp. ESL0681]WEV43882.1 LVIS_2131 family protein [Lactobacillus sp. ESL0684]
MFSWNLLGILLWVVVILYAVFVIQHIRKRRINMIIKQHRRFSWPNFLLNIIEIAILLVSAVWLFKQTMLDNPDLDDTKLIASKVTYQPLVMSTGEGNSSYVTLDSKKKKIGTQTYTYYRSGKKVKVSSDFATVVYGQNPLDLNAERIPYDEKQLHKMDRRYQKAYVATYTATYKKVWQNGIGMHAGHNATRYYLIRIPDASFIKQK